MTAIKTIDYKNDGEFHENLIKEVPSAYPEKTAKKRAKHLALTQGGTSECSVKSNIKSIPGVMSFRGCAYAGSKDVVWGSVKDMVHISHGPVERIRPDLVGSGIKEEKYATQRMGVTFRQLHSWDYSGPYHGYDGFAVFARDMDMAINAPAWSLFKAPWQKPAPVAAK